MLFPTVTTSGDLRRHSFTMGFETTNETLGLKPARHLSKPRIAISGETECLGGAKSCIKFKPETKLSHETHSRNLSRCGKNFETLSLNMVYICFCRYLLGLDHMSDCSTLVYANLLRGSKFRRRYRAVSAPANISASRIKIRYFTHLGFQAQVLVRTTQSRVLLRNYVQTLWGKAPLRPFAVFSYSARKYFPIFTKMFIFKPQRRI